MFNKRVRSKTNSYGVTKIIRDSYSTVQGTVQKNSWWDLRKAAFTRDGGKCVPCRLKGRFVDATEVHHIVPLSKGGANRLPNLISLCDDCHCKRHNHLRKK